MDMNSTSPKRYRLGIDVGGTFTDLQILDQKTTKISEYKTSTTPQDPAIGILAGIKGAAERYDFSITDIDLIIHGTTIATNAVLENKMARVALITTSGFEDILEIARHARKDVYGLYAEERRLLVPRELRFGVSERMTSAGAVDTMIDPDSIKAAVENVVALGIPSVAVCLLNSYANDAHEKAIAAYIAEHHPRLMVSLSSTLSPEIREYERTSTTVLNAALMPIVAGYMERLQKRLSDEGVSTQVLILQSNGGASLPEHAAIEPARLLLSGPCGGTIAAERISSLLDEPNLIAVDMGGTSFDISIVENGRTTRVSEGEVDGCPVRLPMAEIVTIGAGGGSIAWVDAAGRLRVGPQSAGSAPGPACYGRGGTVAAVTDANLVLGRMDERTFMGGAMPLDKTASVSAITSTVCQPLGLGLEQAAEGIISIAAAHMANAIRLSLFERGLDPEDFALVSFGGAGGLHAAAVADEAGVKRIIFPRGASTLSAYGMLWTDIVHDFARTRIMPATAQSLPELNALIAGLVGDAHQALKRDGLPESVWQTEIFLDLRYKGQGYELTLPLAAGTVTGADLDSAIAAFHRDHELRFSHSEEHAAVEIVTVRLTGRGLLEKGGNDSYIKSGPTGLESRPVYFKGEWLDVPVLTRAGVPEAAMPGPVVVEEEYTTILIPQGWQVRLRADGELVAEQVEH